MQDRQPAPNTAAPAPAPSPTPPPPAASSGWRELFSTIGILLTAAVVAVLIIFFVFRSYEVDGPSMQNTLQNADKLIIWKVPRSWARVTGHTYIPKRGDIIVFNQSGLSEFGQQDSKQLIKRVIGVPGDHLVLKDGHYHVYNKAHPAGFDPDQVVGYKLDVTDTTGSVDVTLHAGQLFVSGDNRPDSLDSRAFGPVNAANVVGKLALRVFPIGQAKTF